MVVGSRDEMGLVAQKAHLKQQLLALGREVAWLLTMQEQRYLGTGMSSIIRVYMLLYPVGNIISFHEQAAGQLEGSVCKVFSFFSLHHNL